jgi:hypothetical protein
MMMMSECVTFFLGTLEVLSDITVQVNKARRKTLPDVPMYNIALLALKDEKATSLLFIPLKLVP